ncbi:RagB/SusD family nutrient uptake outer membrane protein [Chitinophaga sp. MM2321]|uniref:RagB/SusD family nutrient uptake outer membrane protein n=1 Tax=Chitinophaga sp. MM2321 TaxID=3137178 RepID=UPI0032D5723B
MKKITTYYICALLCVSILSCKKAFLDKAPGIDVTENTLFSSKSELEIYVTSLYRHGIHHGYCTEDRSLTNAASYDISAGATDEAEYAVSWLVSQRWNSGNIDANDIVNLEDYRFYLRWTAIRMSNIILERTGEVPGLDDAYRNQVLGEAKFVRALNYMEMVKRYGGVPIVDKRFQLTDDLKVPRSSIEDCFNFIVNDCTDAIALLPSTYPSTMRGRATKGAAMMLKARALLYAASPLFNTAQPYLNFGENNKLICYGNEDKNRWQLAADAAKAVIDWAPAAGVILITDKGVNLNYKYEWSTPDNAEVIFANKSFGPRSPWELPWAVMKPNEIVNPGWGGLWATHNFVRKYEKKDGTPQTWSATGGNDLMKKYDELDPRFKQTIAYHGSYWNRETPVMDCINGNSIGSWMHKLIPETLDNGSPQIPSWQIFRLAEAYLNYAEALNEAQGPLPAAYDAVNIIRKRSGMPDLPTGLNQDQFRLRVRNERDIELAYEDQRFWDIRRWMIAENDGVMKGNFWGLKLSEVPNSTEIRYVPYVYEVRTFLRKMYLHPFITSEVNKGDLVQNPGW